MEEDQEIQSTPMGYVWAIVLVSIAVTSSISIGVHIYNMKKLNDRFVAEDAKKIENINKLKAYRDVLKEKGKDGATTYLDEIIRNTHGQ